MRILTRYLVSRFLGYFAAFLIISVLVIAVIEMMLNLGDMLAGDSGPSGIVRYLVLRLPAYYLRDLVPIVAFAAAFFTLARSARWLEILAIEAGGVSRFQITAPILLAGAALVAATLLVNETVVLAATRQWNRRGTEDADVPAAFRQGSFWYHRGRTIYNIADADRATRTLRGVRVFELEPDGRLRRSIAAPVAHIESPIRWSFESPLVRAFDPDDDRAPPRSTQHVGAVGIDLADAMNADLVNADVSTLSLRDLRAALDRGATDRRRTRELAALYHARLAEPLTLWVFVLTAVALGVRVEHAQGLALVPSAFVGIAFVAAFFALRSLATALTVGGLLPPAPAPWLLLAAFLGLGAFRLARIRG